jgi:phosphoglycolate phosphatase-like HAD superfamily hydrolase
MVKSHKLESQKLIFFDFDGVIVDTADLSFDMRKKIEPSLTKEKFLDYFRGNIFNVNPETVPNEADLELQAVAYAEALRKLKIRRGMNKLIKELANVQPNPNEHNLNAHSNYILTIVSSTPSDTIKTYLKEQNLFDCFAEIFGSDISFNKSEKIQKLLKEFGVDSGNSLFITDTLGDILEPINPTWRALP